MYIAIYTVTYKILTKVEIAQQQVESPCQSFYITVETHATSRVDYEQYIQKFRICRHSEFLIGIVLRCCTEHDQLMESSAKLASHGYTLWLSLPNGEYNALRLISHHATPEVGWLPNNVSIVDCWWLFQGAIWKCLALYCPNGNKTVLS